MDQSTPLHADHDYKKDLKNLKKIITDIQDLIEISQKALKNGEQSLKVHDLVEALQKFQHVAQYLYKQVKQLINNKQGVSRTYQYACKRFKEATQCFLEQTGFPLEHFRVNTQDMTTTEHLSHLWSGAHASSKWLCSHLRELAQGADHSSKQYQSFESTLDSFEAVMDFLNSMIIAPIQNNRALVLSMNTEDASQNNSNKKQIKNN